MTKTALPALRALYPEVDEAISSARDSARRAREKHDGMVSALRMLQEEKEALRTALDVATAAMAQISECHKEVEQANYWLNKARTEEAHDEATESLREAMDLLDNAICSATKCGCGAALGSSRCSICNERGKCKHITGTGRDDPTFDPSFVYAQAPESWTAGDTKEAAEKMETPDLLRSAPFNLDAFVMQAFVQRVDEALSGSSFETLNRLEDAWRVLERESSRIESITRILLRSIDDYVSRWSSIDPDIRDLKVGQSLKERAGRLVAVARARFPGLKIWVMSGGPDLLEVVVKNQQEKEMRWTLRAGRIVWPGIMARTLREPLALRHLSYHHTAYGVLDELADFAGEEDT